MSARTVLGAAVAIALAACSAAPASQAGSNVVRFGVDDAGLGAPVFVAQQNGDFAREGIVAQAVTFPLGIDALDATLTGRVDLAIVLDFATATRLPSGQIRILATLMRPDPGFHQLAVRRDIRRPADLAGKRIGSVRATAQSYVTTAYLAHHGIAPDAVTVVSLQDLFDEVAALRAGRIDAGFVWANGVAQAKRIPGVHILENDTSAGVHFFGYLVTSERYARGHRADIVRVLRAFAAATSFMDAHPLAAAQLTARHSGVDVPDMEALLESQHYTVELQPENPRSFVAMAAFATRSDPIRTWPDPASSFDDSYLRTALPARDGLAR